MGNIFATDMPIGSSLTTAERLVGDVWCCRWFPVAVGNQFSLSSPPVPLGKVIVNASGACADTAGVVGMSISSDSDDAVFEVTHVVGELELSIFEERWLDKGVIGGRLGSGCRTKRRPSRKNWRMWWDALE